MTTCFGAPRRGDDFRFLGIALVALCRLTAQEPIGEPDKDCFSSSSTGMPNPRQTIPLGRIVKFAVATAMRQEDICTLVMT